jgi:RHS repeat-associated protein
MCCAHPAMASCMVNLEKPHQGVAAKNPALHQGITWSNSTTALGLRGARLENRIRSRCTGKERDSESGLDMFGARYYGNTIGRFMTADWAAKPTAVPYANFGNPQSLNLYGYVENNPTTMGDPDGHDWESTIEYLSTAAGGLGGALVGGSLGATAGTFALPGGGTVGGGYVGGALGAGLGAGYGAAVGNAIVNTIKAVSSSNPSTPAPASTTSPSPGTQTGSQPGQKDADFVVTPSGTAVATDPGRVRDSLTNAPGVTTRPANSPSGETGTIQSGVKTPNGPVDVRTMDGSASHGPRTVITHPGTNSPRTPDGKATNNKNDNHIPNDHYRPQ